MSFFRRPEMDAWFSHLHKENALEIQFDNYYLCLMMGFATLRDDQLDGGNELIRHFPGQYAGVSKLIIGLLLIAETQKLGKELTNKRDVEFLVNQYLDVSGSGSMNDAGFGRVNDYANGGFNYLVEAYQDKPYHADAFFAWYSAQLQTVTTASSLWGAQGPKVI
jgi:hypothetical protein